MEAHAAAIVLINAFEVLPESDEEFLRGWEASRDYLRRQPGYIETTLHRSLSPSAGFRFVNVARWQDANAFRAATGSDEFRRVAAALARFPFHPSLYEVVRT